MSEYIVPPDRADNCRRVVEWSDLIDSAVPTPCAIGEEGHDKKCLKSVNFYSQMAVDMLYSLMSAAEDAKKLGLQMNSVRRVYDASVEEIKTIRLFIDNWLQANTEETTPWIKTSEHKPEDGQEVLAYGTSNVAPQLDRTYLAAYIDGEWGIIPYGDFMEPPQYWAPLFDDLQKEAPTDDA